MFLKEQTEEQLFSLGKEEIDIKASFDRFSVGFLDNKNAVSDWAELRQKARETFRFIILANVAIFGLPVRSTQEKKPDDPINLVELLREVNAGEAEKKKLARKTLIQHTKNHPRK